MNTQIIKSKIKSKSKEQILLDQKYISIGLKYSSLKCRVFKKKDF